jgi:beta-lactamase class A
MMKTIVCVLLLAVAAAGQTAPPAPPPTKALQQELWKKLQGYVEEQDHGLNGVMGVALLDLTSGEQYLLRGDETFPQASSIKITVLANLYLQDQKGTLHLNDLYTVNAADLVPDSFIMGGLTPGITKITLHDLATMMVAVSDNSATNVLIDRVGFDNVNFMLESLGMHSTRLRRKMMDLNAAKQGNENIATPREMMTLLADIYQGKLLDPAHKDAFFKMLATGKNSPIRQAVPDAVVAADKPGELEAVRADSGVVFAQNRPFVICVMTSYDQDENAANATIGRIAKAAYEYFDRVGRASPYGRVISPFNSGKP